ncbi:hypothetical protein [Methylobacterium sp. D54C]
MARHTANPISTIRPAEPGRDDGRSKRQLPDEFTAWRTVHPASVTPGLRNALHESLVGCEPATRHRSWQDALDGDAAAAIRIAMVVSGLCGPSDPVTDVAASMLLLHALHGDAAAAVTLSCMLRTRNVRLPGDARLASLADAWRHGSAIPTAGHGAR